MHYFFIYDSQGQVADQVAVDDEVVFLDGRVSKGKKHYYKGIGCPYQYHTINKNLEEIDPKEYNVIGHSNVFYVGYTVVKKCFQSKSGVFQEPFQSFYPDFIGSCGIKEGKIAINSITFEKSSVDVIDCIEFDKLNQQSYYILNYKCSRKHYAQDEGSPSLLCELIDFMLENNWNFLWDKKSINDITHDGRISDVGDLFVSNTLSHKLGTVYSVLYSLGRLYSKKYREFLQYNNLRHINDMSFVFNSVDILFRNKIDVSPLFVHQDSYENYKHIVTQYLLTGKNCGYCACDLFIDQGDKIRNKYLDTIKFS